MNTKSLKVLTVALICCLSTLNAQKNVLFIMADDFNHWLPEIGYYPDAKTPNLSKLANTGVLFSRAYVPSPVCNPSRNAIMSGLRPSTSGITSNGAGYIRDVPGFENWVTMNQYFTENGYYTYAGGKIYHPGGMNSHESDKENWSDIYLPGSGAYGGKAYAWAVPSCDGKLKWSGNTKGLNKAGRDTELAHHMASKIKEYNQTKPFFMACGFFRPHLPWNCPKEFYDLYDLDELTVPPPGYKDEGVPSCDHQAIVENDKWAEAIRAYLANMSYADYNVGIVLDALEQSGKADNTIVLFMGDHGWHLGEKNRWRKAANWEHAYHTTLIIYDPTAQGNGKVSKKVVGLQDLYPTLVELCGLPHNDKVEGNSLEPLLKNPNLESWNHPLLIKFKDTESLRTEDWKFVEKGIQSELYNAQTDLNEHYNLFGNSEYDGIVAELRNQMDSIRQIGQDIISNTGTCTDGPSAIADLSVYSSNCTTAVLNWTYDPCATHYIVRRMKTTDSVYTTIAHAQDNSFTDSTLDLNSTYVYNVRPTNGIIKKSSNLAKITTDPVCTSKSSIANGTYFLQIRHSEKYVAVANNSMTNGGNIVQWQDESGKSKMWNITKVDNEWYKITSVLNRKAMEVQTTKHNNGNVRQWGYKGFDWQLWKFDFQDGWYQIISKYSGEALEVSGGLSATQNGANIRQWPFQDMPNQQFKLIAAAKSTNGKSDDMGESFSIYPNPASSLITVELRDFEEKANIEIYNATGQLQVSTVANNSIEQINIENLNQGIYLVKIQNGESVFASKILVK